MQGLFRFCFYPAHLSYTRINERSEHQYKLGDGLPQARYYRGFFTQCVCNTGGLGGAGGIFLSYYIYVVLFF